MKDKLFIMKPGFKNGEAGPFYCGDSAPVEGLLGFFPQLREEIEVVYIDFSRPRKEIVDAIGEDNQSVPVLVLASGSTRPEHIQTKNAGGRLFIDDESQIRAYLSQAHGLATAG